MSREHLIVSEIKRIASDLGRAPTSEEFYSLSKCTQWSVRQQFNGFLPALTAAGFKPESSKGRKTQMDRAIEKFDAQAGLAEAFNKTILPYASKYDIKRKTPLVRIISSSDWHSYWVDPFCFYVFLETLKREQPDVIILGGDVYDFYDLSRFDKDPTRVLKLQDELDYIAEKIFAPIRKACPKAQIDFFVGNHEWRLFKYLCTQAPSLASLRSLQFNQMFELDKFGINLVARPSMLTSKTDRQMQNYKIYEGCYVFSHGPSVGTNHAMKNLMKYRLSGTSGHMHHFQSVGVQPLVGPSTNWTSQGCMCKLESGEEYMYEFVPWQQGFEKITINPASKVVLKESIQINHGEAIVGGLYYSKKEVKLLT